VAPNGTITTVAGTGAPGFSGDGGPATSAQINNPAGLAADSLGNLYIADSWNQRIRMVSTNGIITTVAGNGSSGFSGDSSPATSAQLDNPTGLAVDSFGNVYIADSSNQRIRMVSVNGVITTIAGNGTSGYSGDGGPATSAELASPNGISVDALGNVYIADDGNNRIRKVAPNGNITTIAGNGTSGYSGDGGPATSAELASPNSVAVDTAGNLYIADDGNNRIRRVDLTGTITTIAGNGNRAYTGDGGPALNASFQNPAGVFVSAAGSVYVSDQSNAALRMLTPIGTQPVMTIQSNHSGAFIAGSNAQYTITVANAAFAGATNGTVTVAEIVPSALTITAMAGSGWSCGTSSCTRPDALAAGSSYPPISVTVGVGSPVPVQVTNRVTVSGGGAALAGTEDLTLTSGATPCNVTLDSQASVIDVQHMINEVLGLSPPVNDLNSDNVVNIADLQIVMNAVLGVGCVAGNQP
jgi:sugar lactone lactonase YvrE